MITVAFCTLVNEARIESQPTKSSFLLIQWTWIWIYRDIDTFMFQEETWSDQLLSLCVCRLLWPSRTAPMKSRNSSSRRGKNLSSEPSPPSKTARYQSQHKHYIQNILFFYYTQTNTSVSVGLRMTRIQLSVFLLFIQEQEKQKSIEKKKEEVDKKGPEKKKEEVVEVQKLHVRLKQEQQRWDKECLAREKQQVSLTLTCSFTCLLAHQCQICQMKCKQ